MSIQTSGGILK